MSVAKRLEELRFTLLENANGHDHENIHRIVSELLVILESLCMEIARQRDFLDSGRQDITLNPTQHGEANWNSFDRNQRSCLATLVGVSPDSLSSEFASSLTVLNEMVGPDKMAEEIAFTKQICAFLRAAVQRFGPLADLPLDDPAFVNELDKTLNLDKQIRNRILLHKEGSHESGS